MEGLEQAQEKMKGYIDELKGAINKMMEILQALTTKEDPPQCTVIFKITGLLTEPQRPLKLNTTWPKFGLPPNHSLPFFDASRVGPSTQHVVQLPVITKAPPPPVVHTIPRYAYHNASSHNDGQGENEEVNEVKEK